MQVPGKLGLAIDNIRVAPFEGGRASAPAAERLTALVTAGIAGENYLKVSDDSSERLQGVLTVSPFKLETGRKDAYKVSKGRLVKDGTNCVVTKTSSIVGSYSVVGSDGQNFGGNSFSEVLEDEGVNKDCGVARASLSSDDALLQSALEAVSSQIVRAVSPHSVSVKATFMDGKSDDNKLGIEYFRDGLQEQAISIWRQVVQLDESVVSKAAAFHNMGIAYESTGDLKDAYESYAQANSLAPAEPLHRRALARVTTTQENSNLLKR